jgi:hypothetical protein
MYTLQNKDVTGICTKVHMLFLLQNAPSCKETCEGSIYPSDRRKCSAICRDVLLEGHHHGEMQI